MTSSSGSSGTDGRPARVLGTGDAAVIGLGAMIGAGVFAVFAPAAQQAGGWMPAALLVAAVVAYCNATSTARLAARHPQSGGAYVYGRERLGPVWGYLAGWSFVVGKVASCALMALTFAAYVYPGFERPVALAAVAAVTLVNYSGARASARVTRVLLVAVLGVLAVVVAVTAPSDAANVRGVLDFGSWPGFFGVLGAAGMLFFAFAGYARVATLGGEVREPERSIPRAIGIAMAVALGVYLAVCVAVLAVLGPRRLAASTAPLADAVTVAGWPNLTPIVAAGAALACLGALLSLSLGVSRTALALAEDGHLPRALTAVHPRYGVPHRSALAVGAVVAALVLVLDVRAAVGFSSFGVLVYYAVANASALRLGPSEGRPLLLVPVVGLAGCVVLALSLPLPLVLGGAVMVGSGVAVWLARRGLSRVGTG
ncbi:APC family permease [Marinactinospora rubrisoli]|uniref:APC family permease n=1 Tax=Marinactinospora rubrisoli TaxID=2715399 RepID=A0ABW2KDC5_9ACTN